jgi:hypothetical protein
MWRPGKSPGAFVCHPQCVLTRDTAKITGLSNFRWNLMHHLFGCNEFLIVVRYHQLSIVPSTLDV